MTGKGASRHGHGCLETGRRVAPPPLSASRAPTADRRPPTADRRPVRPVRPAEMIVLIQRTVAIFVTFLVFLPGWWTADAAPLAGQATPDPTAGLASADAATGREASAFAEPAVADVDAFWARVRRRRPPLRPARRRHRVLRSDRDRLRRRLARDPPRLLLRAGPRHLLQRRLPIAGRGARRPLRLDDDHRPRVGAPRPGAARSLRQPLGDRERRAAAAPARAAGGLRRGRLRRRRRGARLGGRRRCRAGAAADGGGR